MPETFGSGKSVGWRRRWSSLISWGTLSQTALDPLRELVWRLPRQPRASHYVPEHTVPSEIAVCREAQPNEHRAPFDVAVRHPCSLAIAPGARIFAVVAIVAHHPGFT